MALIRRSHRANASSGLGRWKWILGAAMAAAIVLFQMSDNEMASNYTPENLFGSISVRDFYPSSEAASSQSCLVPLVKSSASVNPKAFGTDPAQNSSTATVMAMATGYGLGDYKRFVGSLRKTGYQGHIILAVSPTLSPEIEEYLTSKSVNIQKVSYVNCSHPIMSKEEVKSGHDNEILTCVHPYPSLKHRWARFPLLRDHLQACTTCTGPVLITDMRDTVFQRDPFGPEAPVVPPNTLQVFQEHYTITTTHWLITDFLGPCKGINYNEPMLCSGTTIGTRSAMLEYLRVMQAEMDDWMKDPKCCCFKTSADDQTIHNYLFYSGKLDHIAVAIPNRMGLVNTVGAQAAAILDTHKATTEKLYKLQGNNTDSAHLEKYVMRKNDGDQNWLGSQYGMTDSEGYLVNYDGKRSFVAHQIDRFGLVYMTWVNRNLADP